MAKKQQPEVCSGVNKEQEKRWRTEGDVRTLQQACEIIEDKSRIKAVEEYLEDTSDMLDKVKQYRGLRRDD